MQKLKVSNDASALITMQLEPWGHEFSIPPDKFYEVVAHDTEEGFYFDISWTGQAYVKVFPEGRCSSVSVHQDGHEIFRNT